MAYRFGDFTLDTQEWRLTQGDQGKGIEVQQKVLDLLAALVERPDKLWTREDLHERLWPDVFVGEAALFQLVRKARQALQDDAREPRFIATVPNRGYRFVAPVSTTSPLTAPPLPPNPGPDTPAPSTATAAAALGTVESGEAGGDRGPLTEGTPERTHHLPSERDVFVGRAEDLEDLRRRLLERASLVTLIGEGGIGKTRLAVHLGWSMLSDFPGGVWFGDLTEARDAEGILSAVARVLDVPLGSQGRDQLGHVLASLGTALLILDNAEQIVGPLCATVAAWLSRAPDLRVLVTSRTVLALPSEQVLALRPLGDADAAALFVARAQAARRDAVSTGAPHREAVTQLVQLLDGLPLALELAAARTRAWSPELLLARMKDRFRLLTRMGQEGRQTTLWSTFAWGWELLEPWAQAALVELSVFEGGFTLEAAEAVLDLPEGSPWPMDAVQALVDRSWLRPLDGERFGMLLSVQEFCLARASAARRLDAEIRHGQWAASLKGAATELDNVMAACRRATARGDAAVMDACLWLACAVLDLRGPTQAALDLVEAVLDRFSPPTLRTLEQATRINHHMGRLDVALSLAEQGLARVSDDSSRVAFLHLRGSIADDLGDSALSHRCLQQALDLARQTGTTAREAVLLGDLAIAHARRSELQVAREYFEAALALHRTTGDRLAEGRTLGNLGLVATHLGHLEAAEQYYQASLAAHNEMGNRRAAGIVYNNQALLRAKLGRSEAARESYLQALRVLRAVGSRAIEGNVLAGLGGLLLTLGEYTEARQHLEAALPIHRETGNRSSLGFVLGRMAQLHHIHQEPALALALYREALEELRAVGEHAYLALFGARLGLLLSELGTLDEARAHIQEARSHADLSSDPEVISLVQAVGAEAALVRGDVRVAMDLLTQIAQHPPPEGSEPDLALRAARQRLPLPLPLTTP